MIVYTRIILHEARKIYDRIMQIIHLHSINSREFDSSNRAFPDAQQIVSSLLN